MAAAKTATQNTPDVNKVFAAIAEIIGRREGRQVCVVSVQKTEQKSAEQKKAG